MSDDRGWYPDNGADDRGGEGRYRDESGYDPYAQGQQQGRSARDGGRPPYRGDRGGDRGGQPPRDLYQPPRASHRQPPADPYGDGRYGNGGGNAGGNGRGYGNQGRGQGGQDRGGEWTPGPGDRGDGRYGDSRQGDGRYGDESTWSPVDGPSQGAGRRGARTGGADAEPDAWSPRTRSGGPGQGRGGRRTAAATASVGLAAGRLGAEGGRLDGHINHDIDLDEIDPSGRARRAAELKRVGKPPLTRKKKIIKWTAIGVSTTLVLILAVGAFVILQLTGNIKHTALLQNGVTQAAEPTDKYGRSPMNILVIGSDQRNNPADCKIGGDCGPGANADVEMVVHLSADRSNATVMSIPRDTMVNLPHCTDPSNNTSGGGYRAQITTSLQWGPSCTVTAVHDLTGLTIDHFVMVDFVGVETMSQALGGVQVCVSAKMYDPDSGLRLNAGNNTVQGASALAFVRTRHGFYDGSDLGREMAQHYFLSAMIREVRASMNLSDFTTLYKVADAATKALTVDDGLAGVTGLEGLAITMNRVPTDRISFVTMPWTLDPTNQARVLPSEPSADQMFQNIANDVPYSAQSKTATTSKAPAPPASTKAKTPTTQAPQQQAPASPTVAVDKAQVHVQVFNASGASGRASTIKDALVNDGFSLASVGGNATSATTTKVYYPSTRSDSAATVANALGLPTSALVESNSYSEVTVVLGADWTSGTTFGGGSGSSSGSGSGSGSGTPASSAPPTTAASAPAVSSLSNASTTGGCVTVNPYYIVH